MRNTAVKISALALIALSACTLTRAVFERGNGEGCMYYKGRVVPSACIDDIVKAGAAEGYPFSAFSKCMEGRGREPIKDVVPFITEEGGLETRAACRFDSASQRAYYHFDGTDRLYRRFTSCRDGCRMVSDLHEIAFRGDLIFAVKLAEWRE